MCEVKKYTFKEKQEICKGSKEWCPNCPLVIKQGYLKGLCRARDKNGLVPNQMRYGNKF